MNRALRHGLGAVTDWDCKTIRVAANALCTLRPDLDPIPDPDSECQLMLLKTKKPAQLLIGPSSVPRGKG